MSSGENCVWKRISAILFDGGTTGMKILALPIFLLVFAVIPYGIGYALFGKIRHGIATIGGFFFSLAIFETLMLLFHVTMGSLRAMTFLWCAICGSVSLYGWHMSKKDGVALCGKLEKPSDRVETMLCVAVLFLVVLTTANAVWNTTYLNWDDQTYCANAVGSWYADLVNRTAPESGQLKEVFYDKKYVIAGWPIFSAVLAVLTDIHPAIIYRTILPLIEIPLAYFIIYQTLYNVLSGNIKKTLLSIVIVQMLIFQTAELSAGTSREWWFLVNTWSGKALSFNIMIPLILWLMFEIEDCNDEKRRKKLWRVQFVICFACCSIAASLFMTVPVTLAIWGSLYLIRTKRWKEFVDVCICALPTVICALWTLH